MCMPRASQLLDSARNTWDSRLSSQLALPPSRLCPPKGGEPPTTHVGTPSGDSCHIGKYGSSSDVRVVGASSPQHPLSCGLVLRIRREGGVGYGPGKGGSLLRSDHVQKSHGFEIQIYHRALGGYISVTAGGGPHRLLADT